MESKFDPNSNFDPNCGLTPSEYATWMPEFKPAKNHDEYMRRFVNDNRNQELTEKFEKEKNDLNTYFTYDFDFLQMKYFKGIDTTDQVKLPEVKREPAETSVSSNTNVMSIFESSTTDVAKPEKNLDENGEKTKRNFILPTEYMDYDDIWNNAEKDMKKKPNKYRSV